MNGGEIEVPLVKLKGYRKSMISEEFRRTQRIFAGTSYEHGESHIGKTDVDSYLSAIDRKVAEDLGRRRGYNK